MSIDPKLISQLLQLQFSSGDPLSPKSGLASKTDDFADLLQALLGRTAADDAASAALMPSAGPDATARAAAAYGPLVALQRAASAPAKPGAYDPLIAEASAAHGVAFDLLKAVIDVESGFNPYAVSPAGAKGLMQLMDGTSEQLGLTDPFDPAQNINGGSRYLAMLLHKYEGHEAVALAAYNAGPGRVDRLGIRTEADLRDKLHLLPKETQAYVANVLERRKKYG